MKTEVINANYKNHNLLHKYRKCVDFIELLQKTCYTAIFT